MEPGQWRWTWDLHECLCMKFVHVRVCKHVCVTVCAYVCLWMRWEGLDHSKVNGSWVLKKKCLSTWSSRTSLSLSAGKCSLQMGHESFHCGVACPPVLIFAKGLTKSRWPCYRRHCLAPEQQVGLLTLTLHSSHRTHLFIFLLFSYFQTLSQSCLLVACLGSIPGTSLTLEPHSPWSLTHQEYFLSTELQVSPEQHKVWLKSKSKQSRKSIFTFENSNVQPE